MVRVVCIKGILASVYRRAISLPTIPMCTMTF